MELKVKLDDDQEKAFQAYLYEIGEATLKRLEKEHKLNKQLLNKTQACVFLDNCAPQTLNKMIDEGLPCHEVAGKFFLDREEIREWIKSH